MKFLHTADWQVGMKAQHVGAAGERVRQARLDTARKVVEAAREEGVEFVLVAGDTFEDNGVDRVLVQKVADILAGAGVPVYVIPGNHDPLVPGSVWEHPAWNSAGNLVVLREPKPVDIPGGILFPCPVLEKRSGMDPTAWIQRGDDDVIRIALAHGTVEGVPVDELDYPIPRNAASRSGLDYVALGHWHSVAEYPDGDGAVRMAYSGTHEPTKFGERDSGNILIVDISGPGVPPEVRAVPTGRLRWLQLEHELRESGDLARVRKGIEDVKDGGEVLLELGLGGLIGAADREELLRLRELTQARFLYHRIDDSRVRPSPDDPAWIEALPPGVLRDAATRMQELASPDFQGDRPEGASPEVAGRALMELYAIATEVTP